MENEKTTALDITEKGDIEEFKITTRAIANISENIAMAEQLVGNLLERSIDFGRTPGTAQEGLWDPGATKIMAGFNVYPIHEVIFHEESDDLISWTIQCKLISRKTQEVVASGMGGASTREPKYRYRWVKDPQNYGYNESEIRELKMKKDDGGVKYRIENPEYGELVNTLLQMASKRSEGDAVKSLPGVGSALRKLFGGVELESQAAPDYKKFWSIIKGMGLNENAAHKALGVSSMKEWLGQGYTLDDAIIMIGRKLAKMVSDFTRKAEPSAKAPTEQKTATKQKKTESAAVNIKAGDITEKAVSDWESLYALSLSFWKLNPDQVAMELGYPAALDMEFNEKPFEAFVKLRANREQLGSEEERQIEEGEELETEDIPF